MFIEIVQIYNLLLTNEFYERMMKNIKNEGVPQWVERPLLVVLATLRSWGVMQQYFTIGGRVL